MSENWGQQVVDNRTGASGIITQFHAEAVRIGNLPDVRERLTNLGFDVIGSSPQAFAAVIQDNNARLGKVIRDAGIKAE